MSDYKRLLLILIVNFKVSNEYICLGYNANKIRQAILSDHVFDRDDKARKI